MTHGLYLYRGGSRSNAPLYTGTKEQCKQRIDLLSPADRLQGWTITPLPYEFNNYRRSERRLWASIGLAIVLFIAFLVVLALRGHIR